MTQRKNRKGNYFKLINSENKNFNIKMCGMQLKQCLKGKFQVSVLMLEKIERSKISDLRFHLKKLEKGKQSKPEINRNKQ